MASTKSLEFLGVLHIYTLQM